MGYNTDFYGQFKLNKPLEKKHLDYLNAFRETRRVKRNATITETLPDPVRIAAGLPVGEEGCYFVGGEGFMGQAPMVDVIDFNNPPAGQPNLWNQWVPSEDGTVIEWDRVEKFYNYDDWIKYLIEHFLKPWGYVLNGEVQWTGDDSTDLGKIVITDNLVEIKYGTITYA